MPRHWNREVGATAVEYAIMVSMVAVAVIVAVVALGLTTQDKFDCSEGAITNPPAHPGGSC